MAISKELLIVLYNYSYPFCLIVFICSYYYVYIFLLFYHLKDNHYSQFIILYLTTTNYVNAKNQELLLTETLIIKFELYFTKANSYHLIKMI